MNLRVKGAEFGGLGGKGGRDKYCNYILIFYIKNVKKQNHS